MTADIEPSVVSKAPQLAPYPTDTEPDVTDKHAEFAYPDCVLSCTCELETAANFKTVAKVPEQEVPRPVTPLQQMTLLAYAAVDWPGSSECALLVPVIRRMMVLVPPVHAAAVVIEHASVPARANGACHTQNTIAVIIKLKKRSLLVRM